MKTRCGPSPQMVLGLEEAMILSFHRHPDRGRQNESNFRSPLPASRLTGSGCTCKASSKDGSEQGKARPGRTRTDAARTGIVWTRATARDSRGVHDVYRRTTCDPAGEDAIIYPQCRGDGTGSHARLKIAWGSPPCGFDSRPRHQIWQRKCCKPLQTLLLLVSKPSLNRRSNRLPSFWADSC